MNANTQWKNKRSAGVLLPVPMLWGPFGIGVLGHEAREFVDLLRAGSFSMWQVLPVEHTGASYSPYKCVSAFAGEPMLIDPRWLLERGLITERELGERSDGLSVHAVDYDEVYDRQMILLRLAWNRLSDRDRDEYRRFRPFWLDDYALYMALKEHFDLKPWFEWPDEALRRHDPQAVERARHDHRTLIEFYHFTQWLFDLQWRELKSYANAQGVSIIGDIPYYVSEDSAETWSHRAMFATNDDGVFDAVAGAPPDYFNEDGQRWGNPLYNWSFMRDNGYAWWIDRMRESLARYDIVRIDHFRGFESYWRIPATSSTARDGRWVKGPGIEPFHAMERALGTLPVIAEDLGAIDEPVERLLAQTGFPGMRVLQFGFLGDSRHLPHNYDGSTVAYTGTHDNTTLLAWMYELHEKERREALFYSGFAGDWGQGGPNCPMNSAWIRMLYMSKAPLVIVPMQDLLGYGSDTRTNIPGTAHGNWRFRVTRDALDSIDMAFYRGLAQVFDREGK